jgi:hypothetical protein
MAAAPSDILRQKIEASGESIYKIAKGSGVTWNVAKRFAEGGIIGTDQFDKLCSYFDAELILPKKPKGK